MIIGIDEKPPLNEDLLVHFGVKGMRWGHRKAQEKSAHRSSSSSASLPKQQKSSRFSPEQKAKAKKVAIGVGVLTVAAGTAYAAYILNKNGKLPIRSVKPPTPQVKQAVKKVEEQTDIMHFARGKNKGLHFLRSGGVKETLLTYEEGFGQYNESATFFNKLADGRVAAIMPDPLGRKDHSGRGIKHDILIPKSMASGITGLDDVREKIWPILQPAYDAMYEQSILREWER